MNFQSQSILFADDASIIISHPETTFMTMLFFWVLALCKTHWQGLKNFMLAHQSGKYLTLQLKIALLAFL
jgi:hypothetical protein